MKDNFLKDKLLKLFKQHGIMFGLVAVLITGLLAKPDFVLKLLDKDQALTFLGFIGILMIILFFMGTKEQKMTEKQQDKDTIRELLKNSFDSFIQNTLVSQQQLNEILKEILDMTDNLNDNLDLVKERLLAIDKKIYDITNKITGNIPFSLLKLIIRDSTLLIIYEIIQDIQSMESINDLKNYIETFPFKFNNTFIANLSLKYLSKIDEETKDYIISLLQKLEQNILSYLSQYIIESKERETLTQQDKESIKNQLISILYNSVSTYFSNGGEPNE